MTDKKEGPGIPLKDLPKETQDAIKATVDNLVKAAVHNNGSISISIGNVKKDD